MTLYSIANYGLQVLREAYPDAKYEAEIDKKNNSVVFRSVPGSRFRKARFTIHHDAVKYNFDTMVGFFY